MGNNVRSIAQAAGVSVATVSRVLNNSPSVSEALRERVLAVIEQQNYLPNAGARSLSTRRQEIIGVIFPEMFGEFYPELIKGLDYAARKRNYHVLLASTRGDPKAIRRIVHSLNGKVDGIIMVVPESTNEMLLNFTQRVPTVWVNHLPEQTQATTLMTDNFEASSQMVEHLLHQGARRIALINGPQNNFEARERQRGFLDTLQRHGLEPAMQLPGEFNEKSGFAAGELIAQNIHQVDAVFAASDLMALGCLFALNQANIRVPEDVLLAGFDGIALSNLIRPKLTTVRVEPTLMGERAIQLLFDKIDGKLTTGSCELMSTQLLMRESTRV